MSSLHDVESVNKPRNSVANHLPIEIILEFGQYLEGLSLVTSLQVCRSWHQVLIQYVWKSISKMQWHHPRFPLSTFQRIYPGAYIYPMLFEHLRSIEWQSNRALIHEVINKKRRKTFLPRQQLSFEGFGQLFRAASNLTSVNLRSYRFDGISNVWPLIGPILELRHLKKLQLAIWTLHLHRVPLESLFPIFLQLEELKLEGTWFSIGNKDRKHNLTNTKYLQEASLPTLPLPPQNPTCYFMTKLTISHYAMPILRFCPNLKDLNLYAPNAYQTSPQISILPLLNCLNLEKLRIQAFARPGWADVRETISFLRKLKSLSLHIRVVEDFSFLCASPEYQWNYQDECQPVNATRRMNDDDRCIPLPLLENLEVGAHSLPLDTTSNGTFRQCFRDIMRTRHLLKRVVIFGHYFVIDDLFPQLGREIQDGWACINLETLSIWFECKHGGEIERREKWNRLFSQIGKLENLKRLAIRGYTLGFGSATGLSKLAPNGSIRLRELILDDGFGSKWTKEGVARLIEVMPNLECLYLKESRHKNYREMKAWVKELTQRDIEMNDFWRPYRWLREF